MRCWMVLFFILAFGTGCAGRSIGLFDARFSMVRVSYYGGGAPFHKISVNFDLMELFKER